MKASRRAWEGCSWAPSPALTTAQRNTRASIQGTPAEALRTTTTSGCMASMFRAVSTRVSPLPRLEAEALKLITSAESILPAISKEVRVRVEGSKKRFTTSRPRSVGTFLMGRAMISLSERAVSRMDSTSARESSEIPRTWKGAGRSGLMAPPRRGP